jgi:nucleoside-diphosphate-sugar epimerase
MKKKLLFTGGSGFLGENINPILSEKYYVATLGLSEQDTYKVNIVKEFSNLSSSFDIILHAAGKAHSVPKTDFEKQVFFDVNLQGTKNLCAALEKSGIPKSFIFISTVAVYGLDYGENITEDHPLNGKSPYALSKIQAEQFLQAWCEKYNVILSIIRPSLIAGPNPPGNLGAMISGIKSGKYLSIGGGRARKSVLMVQDIANLVTLLETKGGIYNVCDSVHPSFNDLESIITNQLNKSMPISIPYQIAKLLAIIGDLLGSKAPINSDKLEKIYKSLTFSNEKVKAELGWKPMSVIENFKIN